jgi:type VI protein secretion system component VasF
MTLQILRKTKTNEIALKTKCQSAMQNHKTSELPLPTLFCLAILLVVVAKYAKS